MKVTGRVQWNAKGFAFVVVEGDGADVFIPPFDLNGAVHGDTVEVTCRRDRKGVKGHVTAILERPLGTVTGHYFKNHGAGEIRPVSPFPYRILVPAGSENGAREGDIVTARLEKPQTGRKLRQIKATVEKILILPENINPDLTSVAVKYGLPWEFATDVQAEAEIAAMVDLETELKRRRDLRERVLFTIDGRYSRDFDDAVGIEKTWRGYTLTVAIADVAALVKPGTALDREAYGRAFSVYFPEAVIPMLPEVLSNGVLSLNPYEDRLAMVAEIKLGPRGKVISYDCYEAVIRSHARLCYEEVGPFLEGKAACPSQDKRIQKGLKDLHQLAGLLYSRRLKAGSLDLELPELRFELDDAGRVSDVRRRRRNPAEQLIEEAMLLANQTICRYLQDKAMPVLYRIHENPDAKDLLSLIESLELAGLGGPATAMLDKALRNQSALHPPMQAIATLRRGEPIQGFINAQLLRSLKQACYSNVDQGHFGLAMQGYVHFTSPIRRYADLIIHRLLKLTLSGKVTERERTRWTKYLKYAGTEISARERVTNNAMYEVSAAKLAEYMEGHVGETFDGIVVNIMNFGLFVNLDEPPCDGLVPIDSLGPRVKLNEGRDVKYGKKTIKLGDAVKVQLARVDRERGLIDLALI